MPRKKLIRSLNLPYHVTARTNNKELFPIPLPEMWNIMGDELLLLWFLYKIEIHAFVLMPNHFHLMVTTPEEDLGKIMDIFMSNVTRQVNRKISKTGHLFGGPYFWSIVTNGRYYGHALKYIYRNPVRGGICLSVEDYEFSTLRGLGGGEILPFPLHFTRVGMESFIPDLQLFDAWLEWLNQPFPAEAESLIRKCFRKKEIKELLTRSSRTRNHLLSHLL